MTLTFPRHREKRAFCTILYHQNSSSKHFNKLSQSHNNPQQRTVRCYFPLFFSLTLQASSLMYLNHMLSFCFTTNTSARLRIHLQSFFFVSPRYRVHIIVVSLFFSSSDHTIVCFLISQAMMLKESMCQRERLKEMVCGMSEKKRKKKEIQLICSRF